VCPGWGSSKRDGVVAVAVAVVVVVVVGVVVVMGMLIGQSPGSVGPYLETAANAGSSAQRSATRAAMVCQLSGSVRGARRRKQVV